MIAASVGVGKGADAFRAGKNACEQALAGLPARLTASNAQAGAGTDAGGPARVVRAGGPGKKADALIVFGSVSFDQDRLIEGIASAAPDTRIIGCSTAGEISSEGFVTEKSVVIMALSSDQLTFSSGIGNHILWNPRNAGTDCAKMMRGDAHSSEHSGLAFLDIVSGSGEATLFGVREELGHNFPVFGGAAGDDLLFFKTYQYFGDKAYTGSIVGLGISGAHHAVGVALHGFLPVGRSRLVTKTRGTKLHELDGKPATAIYEEYFGPEYFAELKRGLLPMLAASYPLGVSSLDGDSVLLRNPIAVLEGGAMVFASPIPFGVETRLMISDAERGIETAKLAAEEVHKRLDGKKPKAIIIVDSITRKRMIGPRKDEEVEVVQRILGRDVPIAGFYGYAEVADNGAGDAIFHNGSILIWALAE